MNLDEVKQLISQYGLSPTKSKGQNFLLDDAVLERIVAFSGIKNGDRVVEIGPGFGALTEYILQKTDKLTLIELDDALYGYQKKTYGTRTKILHTDVLRATNQEIFDAAGGEYHIVANIPYNITSPILQKFSEDIPKPKSATFMIQKEVAQRVCAKAGEMSILAVAIQLYADVEYGFEVKRDLFWPSPEVDSAVIKITPRDTNTSKLTISEKDFFRVVKFGFSSKRKKLVNTLSAGLHKKPADIRPLLESLGFDENARAQELSVEQWIMLATEVAKSNS